MGEQTKAVVPNHLGVRFRLLKSDWSRTNDETDFYATQIKSREQTSTIVFRLGVEGLVNYTTANLKLCREQALRIFLRALTN